MSDFLLGDWLIEADLNQWRPWDAAVGGPVAGAKAVRVTAKQMSLLRCLAAKPGQVLSKQELLAAVWPGVVVGDDSITSAIYELREALGDPREAPRYIQTVPRKGYRLLAPVAALPAPAVERPPPAAEPPPAEPGSYRRLVLLAAGIALALAGALLAGRYGSYAVHVGEFANHTLDPSHDGLAADLPEICRRRLEAADERRHYRLTALPLLARTRIDGELYRDEHGRLIVRAWLAGAPAGSPGGQLEITAPAGHVDLLADRLASGISRVLDEQVCEIPLRDAGLQADHCRRAGNRLLMERQYGAAVERLGAARGLYQRALAAAPDDQGLRGAFAVSSDLLANVYDIVGQSQRGLAIVAETRPLFAGAETLEDVLLARRAAQIEGDTAREHELLLQLRELDGDNADWRYRYGWFLRTHRRDCAYALQQFDEALAPTAAADPDVRATFYGYRGETLMACGEAVAAIADLERYAEIRPDSPDAWDSLAAAYLEVGRYDDARAALIRALGLDPRYAPALLQKGHLERDLGHLADARRAYRSFLALAGEWPNPQCDGLSALARLAWWAGDAAESRRLAAEALTWRADCPTALWIGGLAAVAEGDTAAAEAALAALAQQETRSGSLHRAEYRLHLASHLAAARGAHAEAAGHLAQALALAPAERCFLRGEGAVLLARAGRDADAALALEEVLRLNAAHPRYACLAGELAERAGRKNEALALYRRALDVTGVTLDDPAGRDCVDRFRRLGGV